MLVILFSWLLLNAVLVWGIRTLPGEKWQIFASLPLRKDLQDPDVWHGINLTWYGLLLASATCAGIFFFFFLLASISMDTFSVTFIMAVILTLCIFSAKFFALVVEKKKATLTVAGSAFTGLFLTPPAVMACNLVSSGDIELMPVMAALVVSYLVGEGLGRLACISFGCCYGRPVEDFSGFLRTFFERFYMVFYGRIKKISYASGLDGRKVVPIQAITAFIYVNSGLMGMYLFLTSHFTIAFLLSIFIAFGWRLASEFLRADYRGEHGRFSSYQIMSVAGMLFAGALALFSGNSTGLSVDVMAGINTTMDIRMMLLLEVIWLLLFAYTGVSRVTYSSLKFMVNEDMI